MPHLLVLAAAAFVSAFSNRILDPLVPAIARDLGVPVSTAALLASAFTFPYALSQPVIGALGDQFGKERLLKACVGALSLALAAAVLSQSYTGLFAARVLSGMTAGGIIPLAFAIIGDRVRLGERQAALARVLMASLTATLLGSALSGLVAVHLDWRTIFGLAAGLTVISFVLVLYGLPASQQRADAAGFSFSGIRSQYLSILSDGFAPALLGAVTIEGLTMFGLFPYVADRLETQGYGGAWEAGLVIAAMSIGGLLYTATVRHLLRLLGREGLIRMGGIVAALALSAIAFSPGWKAEAASFAFLGFGFFSIHNSLQLQATELAPTARASSVALFAFCFFLGQAAGPVVYKLGFDAFGPHAPIVLAGLALATMSFGIARQLRFKAAD